MQETQHVTGLNCRSDCPLTPNQRQKCLCKHKLPVLLGHVHMIVFGPLKCRICRHVTQQRRWWIATEIDRIAPTKRVNVGVEKLLLRKWHDLIAGMRGQWVRHQKNPTVSQVAK
jgi:hypothetical protein